MMKIDIHVHMVGNGSGSSGCRLRLQNPVRRLFGAHLLREFGLPASALSASLEELWVAKLLEYARTSEIDRLVLLAQEKTYDDHGRPVDDFGTLYVPNDCVLKLAREHQEFLAGVAVHPARADALEELERCIAARAVLVKLLPNCQNIDLSDRRYLRFWERMAEARIALLAHTGGELSLPVYNKKLSNPALLRLPLQCGVNVIAAHCGTSSHPLEEDYTDSLAALLEEFPNLYVDNSGMQTPLRSRHFRKILRAPFRARMIYGSDLPIPISGVWAWLRGLISAKDLSQSRSESNPLSRDIQLKRAMGFEEETLTRAGTILNLPH